ncbi:MAG: hypothetical protein ACD_58C00216G0001 [uncultured bacterium]|nr:MAG: hypothetical protein ACD_58C00216G0001 [uncultured bacterium]
MASPTILVLKDSSLSSKDTRTGVQLVTNNQDSPTLTDIVSTPNLISNLLNPKRNPIKTFMSNAIDHMLDLHPTIERMIVFSKTHHRVRRLIGLEQEFNKSNSSGEKVTIPLQIIYYRYNEAEICYLDEDKDVIGSCKHIEPLPCLDIFCSDSRVWETYVNSMGTLFELGVGQGYPVCLPGGIIFLLKYPYKELLFKSLAEYAQNKGIKKCIFAQHGPDCGFYQKDQEGKQINAAVAYEKIKEYLQRAIIDKFLAEAPPEFARTLLIEPRYLEFVTNDGKSEIHDHRFIISGKKIEETQDDWYKFRFDKFQITDKIEHLTVSI